VSHRSRGSRVLRALRRLGTGSCALLACAVALNPACGTSAVGVGDCREIEQARCDAAVACHTVTDAAECKRFYRDQCLHGLPTQEPGASVDECVTAIKNLTTCVKIGGTHVELAHCDPAVPAQNATLACEVVKSPERAYACSFLAGEPVTAPPTAGQGGQGGSE
jgi:hypothetical protein